MIWHRTQGDQSVVLGGLASRYGGTVEEVLDLSDVLAPCGFFVRFIVFQNVCAELKVLVLIVLKLPSH